MIIVRAVATLLVGTALSGCALLSAPQFDRVAPEQSVNLSEVPFFPQKKYQCGPAALATVLSYRRAQVPPDALVDEVYIPERRGTLQAEVVSAIRRRGLVPYVSTGTTRLLGPALESGYPLLVLLNLRSSLLPAWHYAVIVGTDNDGRDVILRSGESAERQMNWWRFELAWRLADYWAVAVLGSDEIPDFVSMPAYLRAVAPWERQERAWAGRSYRLAAERWPEQAAPWIALGNLEVRRQQAESALEAYAEALERDPEHAVALNNAADQLGAIGCPALGAGVLRDRLAAMASNERWYETLRFTLSELEGQPDGAHCRRWRDRFSFRK